jgi:hypothetical protein
VTEATATDQEIRAAWRAYQTEYPVRRAAAYTKAGQAVLEEEMRLRPVSARSGATLAKAQATGRAALAVFDLKYPEPTDMFDWFKTWEGWS